MSIEPLRYRRKIFEVSAIQITEENIEEVAAWCRGEVRTDTDGKYVKVRVFRAKSPSETQARIGSWILKSTKGYKVYLDAAFQNTFEEKPSRNVKVTVVEDPITAEIRAAGGSNTRQTNPSVSVIPVEYHA